MDQRDLVERAGRGDADAFAQLVAGSIVHLEAVARLILRDPELAKDAVQDTYLRVWRDLPGLRDPGRFDAWLHRATVNVCLDMTRRRKRRPVELDLAPLEPWSVGDVTGTIADRDELEHAFRHVAADQRAVLVLHYYAGLPVPAVAETLGIPLGTAQSRLARALGMLRKMLDTGCGPDSVSSIGSGCDAPLLRPASRQRRVVRGSGRSPHGLVGPRNA